MAVLEQAQPLFHRQSTKEKIAQIASNRRLVVYAGAGVTIDRSSLGWNELVSGLLENYIKPESQRRELLSKLTGLQGASAAAQMYYDDHKEEFRDRLTDRLRVLLYNSGQWQKGRLARNIAELVTALNLKALNSSDEMGSCIVTPNYDDYIFEELVDADQTRRRKRRTRSVPELVFPTGADPLEKGKAGRNLLPWVRDAEFPKPSTTPCIHLHGFIPRNANGSLAAQYRHPVVSEQDYFDTEELSFQTLKSLMSKSAVLIVGASMTDPPFLRALAATRNSGFDRFALVPLPSKLNPADRAALHRNARERFQHFDVIPIFLDYYGQIQQFVREITTAAQLDDPTNYLSDLEPIRYGRRLAYWWEAWIEQVRASYSEQQSLVHGILDVARITLSTILDASPSELFKIELWVRWNPEQLRQLNLWASSVGTWVDEESMRWGEIELDSEYQAVNAFIAGRPTYFALEPSDSPTQRWRTYLSIPLYWTGSEQGEVTTGVLTIASMSESTQSALNPSTNKSRLIEAIAFAQDLGLHLVEPSASHWEDYFDALLDELDDEDTTVVDAAADE